MTKVGEGKTPAEKPSIELYHQQIDQSTMKFLNALETYKDASSEDQGRLKGIMDQQLEIIRSSVNELKRAGIEKQEIKVENDYKAYMSDGSEENFAALEHDVMTLREYNQLP
jgi:hypothetical protein